MPVKGAETPSGADECSETEDGFGRSGSRPNITGPLFGDEQEPDNIIVLNSMVVFIFIIKLLKADNRPRRNDLFDIYPKSGGGQQGPVCQIGSGERLPPITHPLRRRDSRTVQSDPRAVHRSLGRVESFILSGQFKSAEFLSVRGTESISPIKRKHDLTAVNAGIPCHRAGRHDILVPVDIVKSLGGQTSPDIQFPAWMHVKGVSPVTADSHGAGRHGFSQSSLAVPEPSPARAIQA